MKKWKKAWLSKIVTLQMQQEQPNSLCRKTMLEDQCYTLSGINVRSFKSEKYLSIPKEGFIYISIDDTGVVKEYSQEKTAIFILSMLKFFLLSILRHTKVATLAMVKLLPPQTQLVNAIVVTQCNDSTNAQTKQQQKLKLQTKQMSKFLHVSHHSSMKSLHNSGIPTFQWPIFSWDSSEGKWSCSKWSCSKWSATNPNHKSTAAT